MRVPLFLYSKKGIHGMLNVQEPEAKVWKLHARALRPHCGRYYYAQVVQMCT
jgi:hypothetical protein